MDWRIESDSMGEVEVPESAYYGAHTMRTLRGYRIGDERFPPPFLASLGLIKQAAALALMELGRLPGDKARLIARAAGEVADGSLDEHFPLPIWQTGSGTAVNMNANEVIANRANELAGRPLGARNPIHPNDDVNLGQSSNDVVPSAMHLSVIRAQGDTLLPALDRLHASLSSKAEEFDAVVKLGRTHLMDALPMTLGQEFSGWAGQLADARRRLSSAREDLCELALGGTAVGTGLNAPAGFAELTILKLSEMTGLPLRQASNHFTVQGSHDAAVAMSAALRGLATALMKIANDIRLLASGPRSGFGEIRLPAVEPGSSIMPGKVNPGQAEAMNMVCAQVMGMDAAVALAGMSGQLQLNTYKPLLIHNLLHSTKLLAEACDSFETHAVRGLKADVEACRRSAERSLMLATALTPKLGYDLAARAAKHADAEGLDLRAAVIDLGLLSGEEFDRIVDLESLTGGNPVDP